MIEQRDKSKRYLRWAAANEGRAASTYNEEFKTLFLQLAAQYRDLAEQIDDPERSRLETRRRVEMFGHLKEHSGAFDPDDIRILVAAFEKAWESIQVGGAIFDTDAKAEAARAILAKHIIAAAKDGEHDQGRLHDGALVALAQSNLRSATGPPR
jgi:hypothetical protein